MTNELYIVLKSQQEITDLINELKKKYKNVTPSLKSHHGSFKYYGVIYYGEE